MNMRRFVALGDEETVKQVGRAYMKAHREGWAELGFRGISVMVHDDERAMVLAEIDVRRADKLVAITEAIHTDQSTLKNIARRNMPKLPSIGELDVLRSQAAACKDKKLAIAQVNIGDFMVKKQQALLTLFGETKDRATKIQIAAKGVAYTSAAAARYRLAQTIVEYAPTGNRVFGAVSGLEDKA